MRVSHNLTSGWEFKHPDSAKYLSATVPGCIHTDLHKHGLIDDPFWGSNEDKLQWIEERNWKYRCRFELPDTFLEREHIDLVADGLDTIAKVILNGTVIAETSNMFLQYRIPIGSRIKSGVNLLEIQFRSPLDYINERKRPTDYKEWNDRIGGSSLLRKAGYSFGWDWGPRFVTCGIYKNIRVEAWTEARLASVLVRQEHFENSVRLRLVPTIEGKSKCTLTGTVSLEGKPVATFEDGQAEISSPCLWWPNGHGKQPLYTVELALESGDDILDTWTGRVGLRTIKLDRQLDQWGESFQFLVNNQPIFAKGANWIPAHSFLPEAGRDTYENLLSSAQDVHMNMIRVWGGGIYETDIFYDLCDEKGILVWQDFMFACALYPGSRDFFASVKAEAEYQVQRLANRASLALWCGNNEIEMMPNEIIRTKARKHAYEKIFFGILPEAVRKLDGTTPYWPSSPHNPDGYEKGFNNERAGDSHFWDVWHSRHPVKRYEEKGFRFCSEFGMQSYSSPEVAATFCEEVDFNVFAPAMENHQKNPAGNSIILEYITRLYRFPKDYASLAYLSQLNQAYCMKVGIEHFRRSMPRTMGALYWQLNDCWPVFSWSSLEFGGKWKALHYAAKRFFSPALISAHIPGTESAGVGNKINSTVSEVNIHTVYDGHEKIAAVISWTLFHLNGNPVLTGKRRVLLRPGTSLLQKTLDLKRAINEHGLRNLILRIEMTTDTNEYSQDTIFLTAPRLIEFPRSPISYVLREVGFATYEVELVSESFQHQVQLELRNLRHHFSDNYIDLFPKEARTVRLNLTDTMEPAELDARIQIRSLTDSY